MVEVEYAILGPLLVRLAPDAPPIELAEKPRLLLGRMLLNPEATFSASRLATDVWGEDAELRDPINTVQATVKLLRQRLGDDDEPRRILLRTASGYRLRIADPLCIDAQRFRQLAARGRALIASHPRAARAMLEEALACWRGPLLGDHGSLRWAVGEAAELESLKVSAEVDLNEVRLALGDYTTLESSLRRQVKEHPNDERRRAQLIRALDGAGRAAEAGLAYRDAARALGALGPELRRLGDRIGRGVGAEPARAPAARTIPVGGALLCAIAPRPSGRDAPGLGTMALLMDRAGGLPYPNGDGQLMGVFDSPDAAVAAARTIAAHRWLRASVAVHAGTTGEIGNRLIGLAPARAQLLARAAHPGQVLVSEDARVQLRTAVELQGLGEHRLEDLLPAEPLYELAELADGFPPPATLSSRSHNLPTQPTRFVGRARELAEVSRWVAPGELVTLLGVGGCGKTRLSLQLGAGARDAFRDGVWFVEFAELDSGTGVEALALAAGQQLGVRPGPEECASDALARHFADRTALLILDNCEHVLAGAVGLVDKLRARCRRLGVIATSRQTLGIASERLIEVPAMATDTVNGVDQLPDAVELLLERAGPLRRAAGEDVIADATRVCRAVEGSPLAIELAAGHIATRGLANVAAEVEATVRQDRIVDYSVKLDASRPPRQRTIQATIRWSDALLSVHERRVLHRLAVFRGSFGLREAQVVAGGDDAGPRRAAELIDRLVERSMVTPEPPLAGERRMRLNQPVRAFALAELDPVELDSTRRRHADVYRSLATRIAPQLFGAGEQAALERLEADHDNFRAALTRFVERRDADGALTLVGALWWLWFSHGHFAEGSAWVKQVLPLDERPSLRRVRALRAGSHLAWWRGDYELTDAYNRSLEECASAIADEWGLAWAPMGFGAVRMMFGDPQQALSLFVDSQKRFQRLGREWEAAYALQLVGGARWYGGDVRAAGRAYESAAEVFERLGHGSVLASVRRGAGLMAAYCDQAPRGEALCQDALRFSDSIGDRAGSAQAFNFLGAISRESGESVAALERYANALSHAWDIGELWATCMALDGIAGIAREFDEPELSVHLFASSQQLADRAGYRLPFRERQLRKRDITTLEAALGRPDYERAVTEGQLMSAGEAVASALAFAARHS